MDFVVTHAKGFLSGGIDPFWTHVVLLSGAVLAEFSVAAGIILESPKEKHFKELLGMWLVLGGVIVSALFTILLFMFDEGISQSQNATIDEQNSKILFLEGAIAPRVLDDGKKQALIRSLTKFAGKTVMVKSYMLDFEAAFLGQQIIQTLHVANLGAISALACEGSVGGLSIAIHVTGPDAELVNALSASLNAIKLATAQTEVPASELHCPGDGRPTDATVFVAIKPPAPVLKW